MGWAAIISIIIEILKLIISRWGNRPVMKAKFTSRLWSAARTARRTGNPTELLALKTEVES